MVKTFQCKQTEKVFLREPVTKFSQDVCRIALRKLLLLDGAESLNDLKVPPGNHLENLGGKRKDQLSIRINDQWRICFRWGKGNALDVEIVNYR